MSDISLRGFEDFAGASRLPAPSVIQSVLVTILMLLMVAVLVALQAAPPLSMTPGAVGGLDAAPRPVKG